MKKIVLIFALITVTISFLLVGERIWREQYSFATASGFGIGAGISTNLERLTECSWMLFDLSTNTVVLINYCGNVWAKPSWGDAKLHLVYPNTEDSEYYAGGSSAVTVVPKRNTIARVRNGHCEYVEMSASDTKRFFDEIIRLWNEERVEELIDCIIRSEKLDEKRIQDCIDATSSKVLDD